MNCERYSEWLGDAVDGTLDPANQAELERTAVDAPTAANC